MLLNPLENNRIRARNPAQKLNDFQDKVKAWAPDSDQPIDCTRFAFHFVSFLVLGLYVCLCSIAIGMPSEITP